ncbi:Conserved_hypothetical protein [Hexamita inflata]|uniref:Transmembrane protein n=1 Tax=Hexamita inflata TaxID=28002 RepID=A0AA86RP74_9EUKA|nr:Conserved hypothetical protein [Hexamita inflata]
MFSLFLLTIQELSRAEKQEIFNCFAQNSNVNIFADSWDIYITINSIHSDCLIPHGILVSLQIDSLGVYEPQAYVEDYDYDVSQEIIVRCQDPICSQLALATSSIIIIESKTEVTYVSAGSVQISRGKSSNCFNDNDSYAELYQGSIVAVLYPTYRCVESITTQQGQQLIMKTPYQAKVFITYSDNSLTIHDQLTITVENDIFVPSRELTTLSVPIRVKLSHPDISKYFVQSITNGVISKDMILFQISLYFQTIQSQQMLKIAQTTVNYYKLTGFFDAFDNITLTILDNGFITQKHVGPNGPVINAYLASLNVDSYLIQYIFVSYDVKKTSEFRARLVAPGVSNGQFINDPVQSNCNVRFPNQGCNELMKQLKSMKLSQIQTALTYQYYSQDVMVSSYTKYFDYFYDSCFSKGYLDYDDSLQLLKITFELNPSSISCSLKRNDVVTVRILLGNNSQILSQQEIQYKPETQRLQISGFDLSLHPEIRVQYFRNQIIQDGINILTYNQQRNTTLIQKQILITTYILCINLGFTISYVVFSIYLPKYFSNYKRLRPVVKKLNINDEELEN